MIPGDIPEAWHYSSLFFNYLLICMCIGVCFARGVVLGPLELELQTMNRLVGAGN